MSKLIWWEKTVEYFFVAKHLPHGFIAPLDGNHDGKWGQATFIIVFSYFLVFL